MAQKDDKVGICGISRQPDGKLKVRFAKKDIVNRIKVLNREGHTDIELFELGTEMEKYDAVKAISTMPQFQNAHAQSVIAEYLEEKAPKAPKAAKAEAAATTEAEAQTA